MEGSLQSAICLFRHREIRHQTHRTQPAPAEPSGIAFLLLFLLLRYLFLRVFSLSPVFNFLSLLPQFSLPSFTAFCFLSGPSLPSFVFGSLRLTLQIPSYSWVTVFAQNSYKHSGLFSFFYIAFPLAFISAQLFGILY